MTVYHIVYDSVSEYITVYHGVHGACIQVYQGALWYITVDFPMYHGVPYTVSSSIKMYHGALRCIAVYHSVS